MNMQLQKESCSCTKLETSLNLGSLKVTILCLVPE